MLVAVATMSSSRIIKLSAESDKGTDFFLEEFPTEEQEAYEHSAVEEFYPLFTEFMQKAATEPVAPPIDMEALLAGMISEEEAQQRIDEAYDTGFAQGRQEVEEDCAVASRAFGAAVIEVGGLRELLLKECEDDLLRLAVMLAERVIRQEISVDSKILARITTQIVESLADKEGLVVRFNPEDYRVISDNRYLDHAGISGEVKADENVTPGGCLIETSSGQVDGQIEAQLSELYNQLMEERLYNSDENEDEEPEADSSYPE